jgi:hypothetical protein
MEYKVRSLRSSLVRPRLTALLDTRPGHAKRAERHGRRIQEKAACQVIAWLATNHTTHFSSIDILALYHPGHIFIFASVPQTHGSNSRVDSTRAYREDVPRVSVQLRDESWSIALFYPCSRLTYPRETRPSNLSLTCKTN